MTPDEKIAALKQGIADGLNVRGISERYRGCTRNAIIGLSNRAGIKLNGGIEKKPRERKTEKKEPSKPKPVRIPDWLKMSPEEKANYVRTEASKGLSWAQIADGLRNATRKAVAKCAQRNGINLAVTPQAKPKRAPKSSLKPVAAIQKVEPTSKVGIMELLNWHCRAPAWDERSRKPLRDVEEWVYCGQPRQHGSSYCPACHDRFWVKPDTKPRYDRRYMAELVR